jgi:hypothetical protein
MDCLSPVVRLFECWTVASCDIRSSFVSRENLIANFNSSMLVMISKADTGRPSLREGYVVGLVNRNALASAKEVGYSTDQFGV